MAQKSYAGMKKVGKNEKVVNPHTGKRDNKLTAKAQKGKKR